MTLKELFQNHLPLSLDYFEQGQEIMYYGGSIDWEGCQSCYLDLEEDNEIDDFLDYLIESVYDVYGEEMGLLIENAEGSKEELIELLSKENIAYYIALYILIVNDIMYSTDKAILTIDCDKTVEFDFLDN